MKNFLLFGFYCLLLSGAGAQKRGNNWYFGRQAAITFNSGSPVALTNSGMNTSEGCASISDTAGNLLFYTNGINVWNNNNAIMPNGSGLMGSNISAQSSIIVPRPGSDSLYSIITVNNWTDGSLDLRYSVVDMSLNGGLGDVIITQKNILINNNVAEQVTAVYHQNGKDIWIISHEVGNNKFLAYLLTPTGLNLTPIVSPVGSNHTSSSNNNRYGYLRCSHNGKKLVSTLGGNPADTLTSNRTLELFDFDNASGSVSNPLILAKSSDNYTAYSSEFSSDDSKLYVVSFDKSFIYQYDLHASDIKASRLNIATGSSIKACVQMGPNKKIYVSRDGESWLGVINNPNTLGVTCNYVDNGVSLAAKNCSLGLPNFITSYFRTLLPPVSNFTANEVCAGDSTMFVDSSQAGSSNIISWQWNFGDGATSSAQNPKHKYTSSGTYSVKLVIRDDSFQADSITKQVHVKALPFANAGADVMICPNDSVQLQATGGSTYSWLPTTGLSNPTISNPIAKPSVTTHYSVKVTNTEGCSNSDTVLITVLPPITYTVTPNPVNLGVTNVDSTKHGAITFTNTTPMRVRVKSATFVGATFIHSISNSFPLSLAQDEQVVIEFMATPKSEGMFTDELCVEMDSACPAKVCIPVTIEGTSLCLKPQAAAIAKKHPGDEITVPILVDPMTKVSASKEIDLTVKFDPSMLRNVSDPTSDYGTPIVISSTSGEISFILNPTTTLPSAPTIIAELHLQVLLSPKTSGEIAVTSSRFKLSPTETITGGNCSEIFSVDSSCIMPRSLRTKSSVSIEGIYPNPSFRSAKVVLVSTGDSHVRMETYDTFGRKVETVFDDDLSQGNHEVTINAEKYANGIYFCRLVQGNKVVTKEFNVKK